VVSPDQGHRAVLADLRPPAESVGPAPDTAPRVKLKTDDAVTVLDSLELAQDAESAPLDQQRSATIAES
jgi:hypothetical protein